MEAFHSRKRRLRWWTLAIVSIALAMAAMDTTIVNLALPSIQSDLQATASQLQWMVDAYNLVFAGLMLVMGALGDRYGRRLGLIMGVAIFAVGNLWAAFVDTASALVAARALTGVGAALMMPATLSIIVDAFDRKERPKAFAIWSAAAGVGVPIGQIVGGLLLEHFAWGSVFLVVLPICALILVATGFLVFESRDPQHKGLDIVGALLSTSAFTALVYAIISGPEKGWGSTEVALSFAGSALAMILFIVWELNARSPMLDVRLFRDRALSTGSGATMVGFAILLGALFLLTQFLQIVRGYTPLEAGYILTALPLTFAGASVASEKIMATHGPARVTAVGLALCGLALLWMSDLELGSSVWLFVATLALLGLGVGAVMAPATTVMMSAVPANHAGIGGALNEQSRLVGIALGVSIFGSVVGSLYGDDMTESVRGLPEAAAHAASDSVGGAAYVAAALPSEAGATLLASASNAFVDAFAVAMAIGAVAALASAALVALLMPRSLHAGGASGTAESDLAPAPGPDQGA